jgi:hypothetical protein
MRRFVTLALVLVFSIPVGLSISGCSKGSAVLYCNGGSSGAVEGQIFNIDLEPRLFGVSLNYGSIGQIGSPSATDCKGNSVGVIRYTYGTTNITYADISPSGGICAGSWNRNSPGGVADYTICSPPASTLPIPSFSTPTAPTATTGAVSTLNYGLYTTGANGTVDILLGTTALTGTISGSTNAATFATAFNAISAFSSNGIVATSSGNIVTVTGPVGTTKTLSFAGTDLGYVPAAYVTASAGGAVSNAVAVYVHPIVTNVKLANQSACLSQGASTPLTATVTGNVSGTPTDITALSGPLSFTPQDSTVVSINSTVIPPVATAELPGSTIISVNTSNAASPAGTFYTCPPKSISLTVPNPSPVPPGSPANTSTSITLNQNTPQNLSAVVVDTNNNVITGLNLEYISTRPSTVSSTSGGSVTANYPGSGSITAVCQPGTCNPSPLNQQGAQGNGLPITSNPIQVTTPGTVNNVLYMASTSSQYFTNVDFSTGVVGSPVRLPYVPTSMVSDQAGQTLYFGSASELMIVNALTNSLSKEDASVKGTVVAVSNDGSQLVISDAVHGLIYIYNTATGSSTSFGGIATRAQFTPDDQIIYITGQYPAPTTVNPNPTVTQNFFVYSVFTGWHTYLLTPTPVDVAVTVPAVAAYLAQSTTVTQRTYCASLTGGTPPTDFYPRVDPAPLASADRLAATNDSNHILGASASLDTLVDIPVTLKSTISTPSNPGACSPVPANNGYTNGTPVTRPLVLAATVTPTAITGVLPGPDATKAFVTYTTASANTTGTVLPAYTPATGVLTPVVLTNGATAPVAGIFGVDGHTFYAGTSGDNLVHIINVTTLTDTGTTVTPALPYCAPANINSTGLCTVLGTTSATPNLLALRPRPTS